MRERINSVTKTIYIPDNMKRKMERYSAEQGLSEHGYVMIALREKIKEDEEHERRQNERRQNE